MNVTGLFLIAQAAAETMWETGGAIALTASGDVELGDVGGDGCRGLAYISSKAAIRGLTRSLSRSFDKYNTRVSAVSLGGAVNRTLFGRIALLEDILDVAQFLIYVESRFITG